MRVHIGKSYFTTKGASVIKSVGPSKSRNNVLNTIWIADKKFSFAVRKKLNEDCNAYSGPTIRMTTDVPGISVGATDLRNLPQEGDYIIYLYHGSGNWSPYGGIPAPKKSARGFNSKAKDYLTMSHYNMAMSVENMLKKDGSRAIQ